MNCPITGMPCNNPKPILVKKISEGKVEETLICPDCAIYTPNLGQVGSAEKHPGLDMLKSLLGIVPDTQTSKFTNEPCPHCEITSDVLLNTGKLGCKNCYSHFGEPLKESLMRLHNSKKHVGKFPKNIVPKEISVEELKQEMKKAVSEEKYEKAAELRDKIKNMETK